MIKLNLLATSGDGRKIVCVHPERKNILLVKEVGSIAGERLIQFSDDLEASRPHSVYFSLDNTMLSVTSADARSVAIFDLDVDPGRSDKDDKEPLPNKDPMIMIELNEDAVAAGFAATRSDEVLVGIRTDRNERMWNITRIVAEARRNKILLPRF